MAIKLCALLLVLSLWGCGGLLFTDVTLPYTRNFASSPVGSKRCEIRNHKVKAPLGDGQISAEWNTSGIANAARKAGIEKIYYADKRTFSVLFGLYRLETIIVYGD